MKYEDAKKLCETFPIIYRENILLRGPRDSDLTFHFECGSGWKELIWEFSEALEAIARTVEFNPPQIVQVKEKFGSLTIYYRNVPSEHQLTIEALDERLAGISDSTCEFCGRAGKIRDTYWEKTMCDDCFSMWNEKDGFKRLYEKYD